MGAAGCAHRPARAPHGSSRAASIGSDHARQQRQTGPARPQQDRPGPPARRGDVRRLAVRAATVALVLGVLAVLDCSLAWAPGFQRPDYYDPSLAYNHPLHGYQSVPGATGWYERADFRNHLRFNEHGRHDLPVPAPAPGGPRLVALGGSFTAGLEVPVESTWPRRLAARLEARPDAPPWQVVNESHQAKRFDYVARLVDDAWLDALQPDLLVVGFSYARLSPDPSYEPDEMACQRALGYRGFSILHGPGLDDEARELVDRQLTGLAPRLYESAPWLRRSNIALALVRFEQERLRRADPRYARAIFNGNYVAWAGCDRPASRANTARHIATLRARAASRGIPVTFAFLPPRSCYRGPDRDAVRAETRGYFGPFDHVIDLCPGFRAHFDRHGAPLHWEHDGHPNAAGYALIADLLFEELQPRIERIEKRVRTAAGPPASARPDVTSPR